MPYFINHNYKCRKIEDDELSCDGNCPSEFDGKRCIIEDCEAKDDELSCDGLCLKHGELLGKHGPGHYALNLLRAKLDLRLRNSQMQIYHLQPAIHHLRKEEAIMQEWKDDFKNKTLVEFHHSSIGKLYAEESRILQEEQVDNKKQEKMYNDVNKHIAATKKF